MDSDLRGAHVLVAEDNSINRELMVELLRSMGAHVSTATDGREALEALACAARCDVVLMDVQMPGVDGIEATRRIRRNPALGYTVVIGVTADEDPGTTLSCRAAGMDDVLTKPVDGVRLHAALAKWLARPVRSAAATATTETPPREVAELVDRGALARLFADDAARIAALARKFVDSADASLVAMASSLAAGELVQVLRAAHSTRGAATMVGAVAFAVRCAALEAACKAGDLLAAQRILAELAPLLRSTAAARR